MNITKEQIVEWLEKNSYIVNDDLIPNMIHDCIQDLSAKWVSVNTPPKEKTEIHFVAYGEIFEGEYRDGKFFEYALDHEGDIQDYIEINNPEYWVHSPTLPELPK